MNTHFTHNTCFGRTALALLLALITTTTARAQVLQDGCWYYIKIDENHALITDNDLTTDATGIIIPETLGGVPVTGFGVDFTLEKYTELASLKFPANSSITTIPPNFVRGCSKLGVVDIEGNTNSNNYSLPTSITTIEAGAFRARSLTISPCPP